MGSWPYISYFPVPLAEIEHYMFSHFILLSYLPSNIAKSPRVYQPGTSFVEVPSSAADPLHTHGPHL